MCCITKRWKVQSQIITVVNNLKKVFASLKKSEKFATICSIYYAIQRQKKLVQALVDGKERGSG